MGVHAFRMLCIKGRLRPELRRAARGKGRSRAAQALRGIRRHRRRSPSAAGTGAPPFLRAEVLFHTETAAPLPSFSRIARLPCNIRSLMPRPLFHPAPMFRLCRAPSLRNSFPLIPAPPLFFPHERLSFRMRRAVHASHISPFPPVPVRPALPQKSPFGKTCSSRPVFSPPDKSRLLLLRSSSPLRGRLSLLNSFFSMRFPRPAHR